MTPTKMGVIVEGVIDDYIAESNRHDAFSQALLELFRRYSTPAVHSDIIRGTRGAAYRRAVDGGYKDMPRDKLRIYASSWRVPHGDVVAIHALIYG
jgi:hypothetical protein